MAIPFWFAGFHRVSRLVSQKPETRLLLGMVGAFAFVLSVAAFGAGFNVGAASVHTPRLILLDYTPARPRVAPLRPAASISQPAASLKRPPASG